MSMFMRLPCLRVGAPSVSSLPPQRSVCVPIRSIAPACPPPTEVSARPPPAGASAVRWWPAVL
jgi:hypothetical protein